MRNLRVILLTALLRCDGQPMPEIALIASARLGSGQPFTDADIFNQVRDLEALGFIAGLTDEISGRSWSLTEKGKHKAAQLSL